MATSVRGSAHLDIAPADDCIERELARQRVRLLEEAGIEERTPSHFKRPDELPFTREQRAHTTVLFGGLTWKHEHLVHGALEGLGYRCEYIPTPDVKAFQIGKEYGNNAQCNPTYFTVGNLVKYLQGLEAGGMDRQEIIDNFVFFTAGACGPCRFGMYEAEFRLALRNSGFDGFRILLFQQTAGINQADGEEGLELSLDFFLGLVNGLNIADLVNEVAHQVRAYEVNEGETDRVLKECMDYLHDAVKTKKRFQVRGTWFGRLFKRFPGFLGNVDYIGKFVDQLFGKHYIRAVEHVRGRFDAIEVDRTRPKPIVKITGEFWAQTTEGDGNYNMFRFLHGEGAQVLVEPIGTWIMFILHQFVQKTVDMRGLAEDESLAPWTSPIRRLGQALRFHRKHLTMKLAEAIVKREYDRLRKALGGTAHGLTDQYEMQRIGSPYYNSRAGGGEVHLEVAKNIYYQNRDYAHMVLSLKPFGCMPSTQSDGAQAAVISHYKDLIYLPVETSGEGEINAHSRTQMALGEAKAKAKEEFQEVLDRTGLTVDQVRAYAEAHPELKTPFYLLPHHKGTVGVAANLVLHVAERMAAGRRA